MCFADSTLNSLHCLESADELTEEQRPARMEVCVRQSPVEALRNKQTKKKNNTPKHSARVMPINGIKGTC